MPPARTMPAALVLAASSLTTVVATAAAPTASPVPAIELPPAKPLSAGVVALDPAEATDGRLTATSAPLPGLDQPRVVFAATGDAEVTGTDTPVPSEGSTTVVTALIDVEPGAEPADPAEAALADASGTTVVATLRADDPAGGTRTTSDRVWVDELRGEVLVSAVGEQDLRLQRVDLLEAEGELTGEEAAELREQIRFGGPTTEGIVTPGACDGALCVHGTVRWTDSAGQTHPVDRAPVQVWDEDGETDELLSAGPALTGADGTFAVDLATNDDGDGTGYDVYVRVLADGPGFTFAAGHAIQSPVQVDATDGDELTVDLTANNTEDNNTAFSVRAALVIGTDQVAQLDGEALPEIPIRYPDPRGSFYDGDEVHVLGTDWFDWDVLLHEFGHYIADSLDIEQNPGGPHSLSANLSDTRDSKVVGTRLAWGEGWPSFFAVATLAEDAAALGIPNVGDSRYQDTVDSTIDVSLEAKATLGEDNERTVMNILWDLYDDHDDGRDQIALGAQRIWNRLDARDPYNLSRAYAVLSPNKSWVRVNCVFTDMNVAPRVDGPSPTPAPGPNAPPTIRWRRGNGGTHRNDEFSIVFRSADEELLHNTGFRTGQSYTPSAGAWREIRALSGGEVRVSVVGRQTHAPATGPYRGCARVFTVG
ncbi:MAG TPA: hypothetical protein VD926_00650 [Acidimicrobiales bacterium]|nr:hypothetical protein [Acidimicrobiales bacterium]